jgi:hypothetical protein
MARQEDTELLGRNRYTAGSTIFESSCEVLPFHILSDGSLLAPLSEEGTRQPQQSVPKRVWLCRRILSFLIARGKQQEYNI